MKKLHGNTGKKLSEEHKRKLRESNKGQVPWSKGKHLSKKHKERIKKAMLGREITWGDKISKSCMGRKPWNKGIPRSVKTKEKISKASMGHKPTHTSFKKGHKTWIKGKTHSKETREKLRKAGIKGLLKLQARNGPTSIEKKVYNELKERGLLFEKQKLINGRFLVDAYIPSLNLIVEADGDYWHSLPKAVKKDKAENAYLTKCGFDLLRLTETEINNGEFRKKLPC